MVKSFWSRLATAALSIGLVSCGGGGGGGDTCIGCPTDGGGTGSSTGSSLSLVISSTTLVTDGVDRVAVRATVKDRSNAAVPEQTVTFSADSGTLSSGTAVTDNVGVAEVTFNSDDNKANRVATVTARLGSLSQTTSISVSGTAVSFGGDLAGVINQPVEMAVSVKDAAGNPIQNIPVSLSSSAGNPVPANVRTNAQGQGTFSFVPTNGGNDTITASALGATATQALAVSSVNFRFTEPAAATTVPVSTSNGCQVIVVALEGFDAAQVTLVNPRGLVHADSACSTPAAATLTVPVVAGTATAWVSAPSAGDSTLLATATSTDALTNASTNLLLKFVATVPASVVVQGSPTTVGTNGTSNVTALVRDAFGNPVAGRTVTFTAPNGGGVPSPVQAVTDSAGRATTVFRADPSISGKDSVAVVASVSNSTVTGQANLTVSGNAVNIRIGFNNQIVLIDPVAYRKVFTALVTDTAGNPVPNQSVTIALGYVAYGKGFYDNTPPAGFAGSTEIKWFQKTKATCLAEDLNNNGVIEPDTLEEDFNHNELFEPNGSASIRPPDGAAGTSVTVLTGADGLAEFWVEYPRNHATWVTVDITATAVTAGPNSVATSRFGLSGEASEVTTETPGPSYEVSPFGISDSCETPG